METILNKNEDQKNVSNITAYSNFPLIDNETRTMGPVGQTDRQMYFHSPPIITQEFSDIGKKRDATAEDVDAAEPEEEGEEEMPEDESKAIKSVEEKKSKKGCCKKKVSRTKRLTLKGNEEIVVKSIKGVGITHAYDSIQVKKASIWQIKLRELSNKIEKIKKKYFTVGIEPGNTYRVLWDLIAMLFIMYNFLVIPFQISFDVDDNEVDVVLSYIIDIFFIFDLILNFFTGYVKRGTSVLEFKRIRRHYLKTWFTLDLISSFPTYIVVVEVFKDQNDKNIIDFVRFIKLIRIFRLVRFVKFLKATRLKKFLAFLENFMNANQIINNLLTLIFIIAMCAHWFGCIWHYIGYVSLDSYNTNWMTKNGLEDNSIWQKYVDSVYWAVTTMSTVGYGDITPANPYERLVAIVAMLLAGSIHAYVLNKIQDIIKGSGNSSELYQDDYKAVKGYMRKKKVPMAFQIKIHYYLQYAIDQETSLNSSHDVIYKYLSKTFRDLLLYETIGANILTTILFKDFSEEFKVAIISRITEKIFSPHDIIFLEDDVDDFSYYYINKGSVRIYINKTHTNLKQLENGDHFGDFGFFTGVARTASAQSIDFCSLYCIDRKWFIETLEKHFLDKQLFCYNKDKLLVYNDINEFFCVCYICHESDHIAKDCPSLHYVVKKDKFIAETYNNKRMPYNRTKPNKTLYPYHLLENRALLIQANLDNLTVIEMEESTEEVKPETEVEMSTQALETETELGSPDRIMKRSSTFVLDKDEMNIPLDLGEPSHQRNKRYPREMYKVWPFEIGFDKIENFQKYFDHNNFKALTFSSVEHEDYVPDTEKTNLFVDHGDRFLGF